MTTQQRLRRAHGLFGLIIGAFLLAHLSNHLTALVGAETHIAVMRALRAVYRHPAFEAVLLAAVAGQIALGLTFLWRSRGKVHGWISRLQLLSGSYLAFFLAVHVGAVLYGRAIGLDTNFYFAAAGYRQALTALFFLPYYFLAVVALFTHLGCAAYWLTRDANPVLAARLLWGLSGTGLLLSLLISASLAGIAVSFEVPDIYLQTYSAFRQP